MVINECDKVKTLIDKKFDNGFVHKGTVGYVMDIAKKDNIKYYLLEIASINEEDPLFSFEETEVEKVK